MRTSTPTDEGTPVAAADPPETAAREIRPPRRGRGRLLRTAVLVIGLAVLATFAYGLLVRAGATDDVDDVATSPVLRGELPITVTAGGSLTALKAEEVKSEVEGNNQILEVVDDGTVITPEDVEQEKVLVVLDSSSLEERESSREMSFQNAEASLIQARENLEIQKKQNESDIAAAKLDVKFARMDLERYLGTQLANQLLDGAEAAGPTEDEGERDSGAVEFDFAELRAAAEAELRTFIGDELTRAVFTQEASVVDLTDYETLHEIFGEQLLAEEDAAAAASGPAAPAGESGPPSSPPAYAEAGVGPDPEPAEPAPPGSNHSIGGTAGQQLRKLAAAVQERSEALSRAANELFWTYVLYQKQYASRNDLEADRLSVLSAQNNLEAAEEELRLFVLYTLPKDAEKYFSDWREMGRKLDRVVARARSEEAQAEANLKSRQGNFDLEKSRLEKTREMIAKSTIKATQPGVVVYATTTSRWGRGDPIEPGRMVRENETILTIPDLSTLAAKVEIHETDVQKLKVGNTANVSVESAPGRTFPGKVVYISPMPRDQGWWSPDVKLYEADVKLNEAPEGITPGMSATAEIVVAHLQDVLYVPVQAVTTRRGRRVCWVRTPEGPQTREVETGFFTNKHVEIKAGLRAGEIVYLAPPPGFEEVPGEEEEAAPEAEPEEQPAAEPEGRAPAEEPAETEEQPEEAEPEEGAEQVDIQAIVKELQGLGEDQRRQRIRELMQSLTDEQRRQLFQQFGGRGGRGQGGPPGGGRRPQSTDTRSQ